ncbi:MAG: HAD family hydrolase [Candidatus Heimdallarchaeaceae archaeon]
MVTISVANEKFKDIELVCLDKDGTVFTYDMYVPVMKKRAEVLIQKFGLPNESYTDILEIMGVNPEDETIVMGGAIHDARVDIIKATIEYLRKHSVSTNITELASLFDEIDDIVDFTHAIRTYPGVIEFLQKLKEKGVKIIMITFDTTAAAKTHLKHAQILEYFDLVLGLDFDSPYNPKPAPDMLQYACKVLDVDVRQSIVIGDDNKDMLIGKNAGALASIGVLTGRSKEEELQNADVIISSISEIKVK